MSSGLLGFWGVMFGIAAVAVGGDRGLAALVCSTLYLVGASIVRAIETWGKPRG